MNELEEDIVWNMEVSEARLCDDITFLHCIHEEFLSDKEPKESTTYLYWQLSAMIPTLIKSMEYNQKEMKEAIDNYYKKIRKESDSNGNTSVSNSEKVVVENQQV